MPSENHISYDQRVCCNWPPHPSLSSPLDASLSQLLLWPHQPPCSCSKRWGLLLCALFLESSHLRRHVLTSFSLRSYSNLSSLTLPWLNYLSYILLEELQSRSPFLCLFPIAFVTMVNAEANFNYYCMHYSHYENTTASKSEVLEFFFPS